MLTDDNEDLEKLNKENEKKFKIKEDNTSRKKRMKDEYIEKINFIKSLISKFAVIDEKLDGISSDINSMKYDVQEDFGDDAYQRAYDKEGERILTEYYNEAVTELDYDPSMEFDSEKQKIDFFMGVKSGLQKGGLNLSNILGYQFEGLYEKLDNKFDNEKINIQYNFDE